VYDFCIGGSLCLWVNKPSDFSIYCTFEFLVVRFIKSLTNLDIMKVTVIAISFLTILLLGCKPNKVETVTNIDGSTTQHFGEKIDAAGAISYDELLAKLETSESVENVKVKGKVDGVCQAKGCWMNITSETAGKEEMFVKFKDYGFFMPLDLEGEVVMRGKAYKEETSVDELRHYAEDEGKSKEEIAAITEPVIELKFMADGVVIE